MYQFFKFNCIVDIYKFGDNLLLDLLALITKDAIIRAYGLEIWQRVEEYIELDGNEIIVKNIYSDSLFPRIIDALMIFRNTGSPATYMEFFGIQKKYAKKP